MVEDSSPNVRVVMTSSDDEGDDRIHVGKVKGDDLQDDDREEELPLKKMISGHPLYGSLLDNHIDCLKVCLGERGDEIGTTAGSRSTTSVEEANANIKKLEAALTNSSSFELDQFMETYCNALNEHKEAMGDSLKEAASFINSAHAQLDELTGDSKETKQGHATAAKPDQAIDHDQVET